MICLFFSDTQQIFSNNVNTSTSSYPGAPSRFMSPHPVGLLQGNALAAAAPVSPIHQMVSSPAFAGRLLLQQKEDQIRALSRQLNAEKQTSHELDAELQTAKDVIDRKGMTPNKTKFF